MDWFRIEDYAKSEHITPREAYRRVRGGEVAWRDRRAVDGHRGTMIHKSAFSPEKARDLELAASCLQFSLLQRSKVDEQADALPISPMQRDIMMKRFRIVQLFINCNWKSEQYPSKRAYAKAIAKREGISARTIYRWKEKWEQRENLLDLLRDKPGPEDGTGSILDKDMRAHIYDCYVLKRLTPPQCHSSLKRYLAAKQHGAGVGVAYGDPSESTTKRYIRKELRPKFGAEREGKEAVKAASGYLDCTREDEFSGDSWCVDEWEVDGAFCDERDHRRIFNYGAGRPIVHILSIIDERTSCVLDHLVTWQLSLEDAVFALAERTIRQHFLPKRVVSDRAGRFRALVRGHIVVGSDGDLIKKLAGPLGDLGVIPRGSEEKNPRANRVERLHRMYADRAREFGASWKPPLKGHKHREIDDAVDRHLNIHCRYGTIGPQLMFIQEAERMIARWVEEINLAETEAEGCHGLTRLAAFRQFQPPAEEIARRKPTQVVLDLAFAERDERAIREGGIIELKDGARYSSPQLIEWRTRLGETKVPVMCYRRDPLHLIVSPPGADSIVAERRAIVGTKDEELLSLQIEKQKHLRKIFGGSAAELDRQMREIASSLPKDRRAFSPSSMPAKRMPTSAEAARQILEMKD